MKYNRDDYSIGQRLKKIRKERGLTQEEVAEMLGKSIPTIKNYESGQHFNFDTLLMFCDVYECDLDHIMGVYPESTKNIHFICSETGLIEKAVKILQHNRFFATEGVAFDELSVGFLIIVDHIIKSYPPYGDEKIKDSFPIDKLLEYFTKIDHYNKRYKVNKDRLDKGKALYDRKVKDLIDQGKEERTAKLTATDKEEWSKVKEWQLVNDYYEYKEFEEKEKKYMRIDIQDAFSRFLTSDFIEGKER